MRRGAPGLRPVHIVCLLLFVAPPAARLGRALWWRGQGSPAAAPAGAEALAVNCPYAG